MVEKKIFIVGKVIDNNNIILKENKEDNFYLDLNKEFEYDVIFFNLVYSQNG
jgi:hypothetical protein